MGGAVKTYAFINAKLRARISKLLNDDVFRQMETAHSLDEALHVLRDTPFAIVEEVYERTGDLKLGELELYKTEITLYNEIVRATEGMVSDFVSVLAMRYEIENVKNALRLWFDRSIRGRDITEAIGYVCRGEIRHSISLDSIINASSLDDIITQLKGTPYAAPLTAAKEKILTKHSVFSFEVALDQMYYEMLLHDSEKFDGRDRDIIRRLVGIEIDLQNINFLIRLHAFYKMPVNDALNFIIPRGYNFSSKMLAEAVKEDSVTDVVGRLVRKKYAGLSTLLSAQTVDSTSRLILIERILDQILLYEVRRALSGYPFTIGVVLAYFVLKHNEHKKLISVLNAKQYGMSESRIKEMI